MSLGMTIGVFQLGSWMSSRSTLAPALVVTVVALLAVACVESGGSASPGVGEADGQIVSAPEATAEDRAPKSPAAVRLKAEPVIEEATPEAPEPKFDDFDFSLTEGAFWEYRWETKSSYFAARSSSSDRDNGTFRVTLGRPKEIHGVMAYEVMVSGKHWVDDEDRSVID